MRGNGSSGKEPEERRETRQHLDETEIGSDIHHPKASDCSHDTDDEDDEDPRLAKRRRLSATDNALTQHNEPTPLANNDHHPSRNPSVIVESAAVAEY